VSHKSNVTIPRHVPLDTAHIAADLNPQNHPVYDNRLPVTKRHSIVKQGCSPFLYQAGRARCTASERLCHFSGLQQQRGAIAVQVAYSSGKRRSALQTLNSASCISTFQILLHLQGSSVTQPVTRVLLATRDTCWTSMHVVRCSLDRLSARN